ncbi:MAG: gamma-glutamyltransferase [Isosphaeraceae bacterium]|nr:gamma-glutamyltransferase [Isosphaeraceae bacterium]
MIRQLIAVGILAIGTASASAAPPGTWEVSGTSGVVVAGGEEAVAAGIEVLRDGGNAVDAAVATILALSVTDATSFCFGGEVPILIYDARRGVVEVIAGQGAAPRLATQRYFEQRGGIPGTGVEPAAVPAVVDACVTALDRSGTRTFAQVAAPALRLLDRGVKDWHLDLARTIRRLTAAEGDSPGERRRGLRLVADAFYRGAIAREIDDWSRTHGGLVRYTDLATHVTRVEEPVSSSYRGLTVVKCGPWTQGPYLLEALQLLEGYDLKAMGHNRPDTIHTTVEALKLALADRDTYYADPLFADVPLAELLAPQYASKRRALIDPRHASLTQRPGNPRAGHALLDETDARRGVNGPASDTTTCLTADRFGNVVAATPSGWSGVVAGKTGVWLGTRLQSFNTWPGHPNCIEPGKRPRITLTPTLVLKDGKPLLAVSVAGGDNQEQMTLQLLLDQIDFGLPPADAVTAPRFMSDHFLGSFRQAPPKLGQLRINPEVGETTLAELSARGHRLVVQQTPLGAAATAVSIDPSSKLLRGAGDPRAGRHAGAY